MSEESGQRRGRAWSDLTEAPRRLWASLEICRGEGVKRGSSQARVWTAVSDMRAGQGVAVIVVGAGPVGLWLAAGKTGWIHDIGHAISLRAVFATAKDRGFAAG